MFNLFKNKKPTSKLKSKSRLGFIILFFASLIYSNSINAQLVTEDEIDYFLYESDVTMDVAPFDIGLSFTKPVTKSIAMGIGGEFGVNFSNLILGAGTRVGTEKTLFLFEEMDEYDSDRYIGIYRGHVFTRLFYDKKMPVEIGLQAEFFFHSVITPNEEDVNTGFYYGPFVKAFIPSKYKTDGDERKRYPAFGVEASFGNLQFSRYNADSELALMLSFWLRFDMDYNDW